MEQKEILCFLVKAVYELAKQVKPLTPKLADVINNANEIIAKLDKE